MTPYSSMLSKNTRIMEEVWKDISLSSLQQDLPSTPSLPPNHHESLCGVSSSTTTAFRRIILQDFLTEHFKAIGKLGSPSTALGLNSNLGGGSNGLSTSSASSVFSDGVGDGLVACGSKKHPLEHELNQEPGNRIDADRRKKRMIKNRESAARDHTVDLTQVRSTPPHANAHLVARTTSMVGVYGGMVSRKRTHTGLNQQMLAQQTRRRNASTRTKGGEDFSRGVIAAVSCPGGKKWKEYEEEEEEEREREGGREGAVRKALWGAVDEEEKEGGR
ncbi:hypothetical protein BHM03_00026038 [Ensete ventricosum]|nr:hypothetical protein BHM03_00026038 [Ensete ventricosum]